MITSSMKAEGFVTLRTTDRMGKVRQELTFKNAVLDAGINSLIKHMHKASGGAHFGELVSHLFLGTGTTQPTTSDTGLENRSGTLVGKNYNTYVRVSSDVIVSPNHAVHEWQFQYRYGEGEAEGVWTELGLADSTYSHPFTRSLIKDDNGDPVSITVLSDEFLSVDYNIIMYAYCSGEGTVDINGEIYNWKVFINPRRSTLSGSFNPAPDFDMIFYHNEVVLFDDGTLPLISGYQDMGVTTSTAYYTRTSIANVADNASEASVVINPTDNDLSINAMGIYSYNDWGTSYSGYKRRLHKGGVISILFDRALVKPADHRTTFDIQLSTALARHPVLGITHTATSSSLDFTWDAYPDATGYTLVLRQAGTEIATQTVTAPTVTASFTGLTDSTLYDLEIKATWTAGESEPIIYSAQTGAA